MEPIPGQRGQTGVHLHLPSYLGIHNRLVGMMGPIHEAVSPGIDMRSHSSLGWAYRPRGLARGNPKEIDRRSREMVKRHPAA